MHPFRLNIAFFLIFWAFANVSHGTSPSINVVFKNPIEALLRQAEAYFKDAYYYQASVIYQKVLELESNQLYAHYQIAECFRQLFQYENAKYHYQEVFQSGEKDYPLAGYYLALMCKLTGEYNQSVNYFDDFIHFARQERFDKKSYYLKQAQREKEGSLYGLKNTIKPKGDFSFARLSFPVNSEYNDYAPAIYHNDSCIFVTSTRIYTKKSTIDEKNGESYSDHFLFCQSNNEWKDVSKTHDLSSLNTKFSEGTGVFLGKKETFYFTGCYQEGYCHIFQSKWENGEWQSPTPLNENINLRGYESKQPALTHGGDTLFFVSNRPGGYGGQDLWMSIQTDADTWGVPVNLGPEINTLQNEVSPFYYPDENVLFFASDGHQGYGGFDIFLVPTDNFQKQNVINLGAPFNSFKDDLYLSLGTQQGYLSSNRDNVAGDFDIYSFDITTPQSTLLALQNNDSQVMSFNEYFDILHFFSKQDQQYYEELPLEKKMKINRYIESHAFREIIAEKATLSDELQVFYEQLPTEEKEFIEKMVIARKNMLLRKNEDISLAEESYYYQQLPSEKKEKIARIVESKYYQKILQEDTNGFESLEVFYESLPLEEKEKIQRILNESKEFATKNYQGELSLEDIFFYQALPTEEKAAIDRAMRVASFSQATSPYAELKESKTYFYEQLPVEAQDQVNRIIKARQFAAVALNDAELLGFEKTDQFDIGVLAIGNPQNITIEGKLTYKDKPATAVKVGLKSDDGQTEKLAVTNDEGNFKFFNVNYHQQQKIFFGEEDVKFLQLAQYTVEELKITVLQDTIIKENFDNIFFEIDQFAIPAEGLAILDSLASFHHKYPDVQIEISAYTDTVGSKAYNLQLSNKRAQAAYQYLVKNGVDPTALHIFGKGKEVPEEGKDLQYSRRIEFELQGVATSYNPTRKVYAILAEPDLQEIAAKYNLTLETLKKLNPNMLETPSPFTPVCIMANE